MKFFSNSRAQCLFITGATLIASIFLTACQGGDGPDPNTAVQPAIAQSDYTNAAGPSFHVQSGGTAPLNCVGPDNSSYQWIIQSNANLPIGLSSSNTAATSFTAPIVPVATEVSFICRMTVTNTVINAQTSIASKASTVVKSTVVITIDPLAAASTLVTTISGNQTVIPGSRLTLTANSAWYDAKGAIAPGPIINYSWSLGAGAPAGTIITPATGSALVDVIVPTSIPTAVFFPVTVIATSGSQTSQATITVLVDRAGTVSFAITPQAQSVQAGAAVSLNATSGTDLFYQWTIVSGPATMTLGGVATNTVGFVAPTVKVDTNIVLRVAIGYAPITPSNPGIYFLDGVVTVHP